MKRKFLILAALLSAIMPLFAQKDAVSDQVQMFNPVMTGVTSLTIAPDSRAGAMGDVGAATDADVNSQYWNPAKYPFAISPAGFSLAYTPWLRRLVSDIDLANLVGSPISLWARCGSTTTPSNPTRWPLTLPIRVCSPKLFRLR